MRCVKDAGKSIAFLWAAILMTGASTGIYVTQANAQAIPRPVLVSRLKLSDLPGRWIGVGRIEFRNGRVDRMRCWITYRRRNKAQLMQQIRCKSPERRIEVKTQMYHRNGKISGAWKDHVYEVSGNIKGRLHGNQLKAYLSGMFFNAALNIMIIGKEQTIEVRPRNSRLRSMRISLARG